MSNASIAPKQLAAALLLGTALSLPLAAAAVSARAGQEAGHEVGVLTCKTVPDSRVNLIVHSSADIECEFKESDGTVEHYTGQTGIGVGVDLHVAHEETVVFTVLAKHLDTPCRPVYCTKVASKLVRTFTDRHGLKDLCRELLGIEISKQQQSSDWGAATLSQEQLRYAASDVLHLHRLREQLDLMLAREGRAGLAQACFDFLPSRAALDLAGWADEDIFAH